MHVLMRQAIAPALRKTWLAAVVLGAGSLAIGQAAIGQAASDGNIIVNPGFETGSLAPAWVAGSYFGPPFGSPWAVAKNFYPHSGQYSAVCSGPALLTQMFAPVATSTITSITFFEEQSNPLADNYFLGAVYLLYSDGGASSARLVAPSTGSPGYTLMDVTSLLQPGVFLDGIQFYGESYSGKSVFTPQPETFLDDVSINVAAPVPEASTTVSLGLLLALGLGGLVVAMRRKKAASAQ